ncbi:alpha/beta fold hydrolase [Nocardia sp. CA-136227]|uniref:alpha/beta fold hydrolase n=1 Tax=Nocardia sp. CA-136227 TaxID=3239979 RepID=UPI003D98D452
MHTLRTKAGELAYTDTGSGPAVVLLHANLHDHHDFDPIIPTLEASYRVIAVDWPGHGAAAPNTTMTAADLADALAELTTTLDLKQAVYLGNSVGAFAAARLAIDHPDRIAGLILVNGGGLIPRSLLTRAFYRVYGSTLFARRLLPRSIRNYIQPLTPEDEAVIDRVTRTARTEVGRATYSSLWRSFASPAYDLTPRASEIKAPTLIVWGALDPIARLRYGKQAHHRIPGSELRVLPTGHLPFSSAPSDFLEIVLPFIESAYSVAGKAG